MRQFIRLLGLLLLSAYVASWLRMLDPRLALRPWADLPGLPVRAWVGAAAFYPVLELVQSWPAYALGGPLFFGLAAAVQPRKRWQKTLLAACVGGGIYLIYASVTRDWLLKGGARVLEQLVIYAVASALLGFWYHAPEVRQEAA